MALCSNIEAIRSTDDVSTHSVWSNVHVPANIPVILFTTVASKKVALSGLG